MDEHAEARAEGFFEIVWYQHNPDDWMAVVVNQTTGERHIVYSLGELAALLLPPQGHALAQPVEPGPSR
jgi:hypothetical protein